MCTSFEEFDRCRKCSKIWNIDFHTILCYQQRCGLAEPTTIEPLINNDFCALCRTLDARAEERGRKGPQKLKPLVWESDSNGFSCVWTAPR